jgi:phage terminase large subunit-like protein
MAKRTNPVTDFANRVIAGDIISGPHVRAAARRHLDDLDKAPRRGFVFDEAKANRVIRFFNQVLHLNGGQFEGIPFKTLPWQNFVLGSLFGWVNKKTGFRRYTVAYIETGKGSGKSPLVAGIGLYGLVSDGERASDGSLRIEERPEIYSAATKKDQAAILFKDAVAMVRQSPELSNRVIIYGSKGREHNLAYHANNGYFRPISSDKSQSGPRPHFALIDEYHEHPDNSVKELLQAGFKFREQPLLIQITNSGAGLNTPCGEEHAYATQVADRVLDDDHFFAFVCGTDSEDDPFADEACWAKANPSLQVLRRGQKPIPRIDFIRGQVRQAKGLPGKESLVRRLHFCQWVESGSPWLDIDTWQRCNLEDGFDPYVLLNRKCHGGLDLSAVNDLTAFCLLFEPTEKDPWWRLMSKFWIPADGLLQKETQDRVPYIVWRNQGHLVAIPGKTIDLAFVLAQIAELCAQFKVESIAYDRWRIKELKTQRDKEGINIPELVEHGQGYKDMAPAIDAFERLLIEGNIRHDNNPVLRWNALNAVVTKDPALNRKLDKAQAKARIDGIIAAVMACGLAHKGKDSLPVMPGDYELMVL